MKKQTLTVLALLGGSSFAVAQQNNEAALLKQWLSTHSHVKLVSKAEYQAMNVVDKARLDATPEKLIYMGSQLSWAEAQNYQPTPLTQSYEVLLAAHIQAEQQAKMMTEQEAIEVKQWVANHPEVKILSMAEFQSASTSRRAEMMALRFKIIYAGNQLTMADIKAYTGN